MATGTELLHYGCQREIVALYEASSPDHTVAIRRDRNGWLSWKLNGRKTELCTRDAMERIEIAIHRAKATAAAKAVHKLSDDQWDALPPSEQRALRIAATQKRT